MHTRHRNSVLAVGRACEIVMAAFGSVVLVASAVAGDRAAVPGLVAAVSMGLAGHASSRSVGRGVFSGAMWGLVVAVALHTSPVAGSMVVAAGVLTAVVGLKGSLRPSGGRGTTVPDRVTRFGGEIVKTTGVAFLVASLLTGTIGNSIAEGHGVLLGAPMDGRCRYYDLFRTSPDVVTSTFEIPTTDVDDPFRPARRHVVADPGRSGFEGEGRIAFWAGYEGRLLGSAARVVEGRTVPVSVHYCERLPSIMGRIGTVSEIVGILVEPESRFFEREARLVAEDMAWFRAERDRMDATYPEERLRELYATFDARRAARADEDVHAPEG